jgi:hypothetical protein
MQVLAKAVKSYLSVALFQLRYLCLLCPHHVYLKTFYFVMVVVGVEGTKSL